MNAFLIDLDNKVGELARVAEAIAAKGVNITSVSGSTCGSGGSVAIVTGDEATTRTALKDVGCSFREVEATTTALRNQPGALATAARRLADGGVNIDALMLTGMQGNDIMVTFITGDPAKARDILSHSGSAAG
jgi:hypothetical protein